LRATSRSWKKRLFEARGRLGFARPGGSESNASDENWARIAFEYSADLEPPIVSVITRTKSDDSGGPNLHWVTVNGLALVGMIFGRRLVWDP